MTCSDPDRATFNARVDALVEHSYSRVMPPHQRDLVKRMAKGETYDKPRPYIDRHLNRVAREVLAVISAGQP